MCVSASVTSYSGLASQSGSIHYAVNAPDKKQAVCV